MRGQFSRSILPGLDLSHCNDSSRAWILLLAGLLYSRERSRESAIGRTPCWAVLRCLAQYQANHSRQSLRRFQKKAETFAAECSPAGEREIRKLRAKQQSHRGKPRHRSVTLIASAVPQNLGGEKNAEALFASPGFLNRGLELRLADSRSQSLNC